MGSLELDHLPLPLLVSSQLKVFASLDGQLPLELAFGAFNLQDQLLGGFGLWKRRMLALRSSIRVPGFDALTDMQAPPPQIWTPQKLFKHVFQTILGKKLGC